MSDRKAVERRKIQDETRRLAAERRAARAELEQQKEAKLAQSLLRAKAKHPDKPRTPMGVLLNSKYADAVRWANSYAIREPSAWRPVGKSVDALFFSYISHVLVKHPTPKHLYQCLSWKSAKALPRDFFLRIAHGESVFKVMKETFDMPVTRKMAHVLMTQTHGEEHPFKAIRLAQVLAHGGTRRLYTNLPAAKLRIDALRVGYGQLMNQPVPDFKTADDEKFYDEVVAWLCRQTNSIAMFDYNQIEPMLDFFNHCRLENKAYSVAGRTLASVTKAMEDWHKVLGKGKDDGSVFPSCSIPSWSRGVEYEENGQTVRGKWEVKEILTDKRLREEGRDMRHCVATYAGAVKAGRCAIFSLTYQKGDGEVKKQVTIRLDPKTRSIQEARGFANGKLAPSQATTMRRWANENQISSGYY